MGIPPSTFLGGIDPPCPPPPLAEILMPDLFVNVKINVAILKFPTHYPTKFISGAIISSAKNYSAGLRYIYGIYHCLICRLVKLKIVEFSTVIVLLPQWSTN